MKGRFAELLRGARHAASLTQEELAERAGLTVNAIGQLERGERTRPYPATVRAIADALELQPPERAALIAAVPSRRAPAQAGPSAPGTFEGLIGRDAELAAVREALTTHRLVTITGTGGVGKTALAMVAAVDDRVRFPDGVTTVALAESMEVVVALHTIARAVGVIDSGVTDVRDQLARALAGKARLLVLDNLEQLPDLAGELAGLLERCPDLRILATSRSRLRLRLEEEVTLAPLAVPSIGLEPERRQGDTAGVLDSDAARLLLLRAGPHLDSVDLDECAVATICQLLDGLPLAIELAAGWLRVLTVGELAERLVDGLPLLVDSAPDRPARHRTMRAAIAWSDALLEPDQQQLFRRLAILPAAWTLATAAAVVDRDDDTTLHGVAILVERNLVHRGAPDQDGRTRFRLLETVRAYASEQLDAHGERDEVQALLTAEVARFLDEVEVGLEGADQGRWLDRCEDRLPDIRATLRNGADGDGPTVAAKGYSALMWFWYLRHAAEGEWLGVRISAMALNDVSRARTEATCALLVFARGELSDALARATSALTRADAVDDPEGRLRALAVIAHVAAAAGDPERVRAASRRIRQLARPHEATFAAAAAALGTLAEVRAALSEGDGALASALLGEADEATRAARAPWLRVLWLNISVGAAHLRGDSGGTREMLHRSIELCRELGDAPGLLYALASLGVDLALCDEPRSAARVFGAAASHGERTGQQITDRVVLGVVAAHRAALAERLGPHPFDRAVTDGRLLRPQDVIHEVWS